MAHTYSIDHLGGSTESVTLEVAPKSEMTLRATDEKEGIVTATYRLASGDTKYPSTVTYRVEETRRGGAPVRRVSMTFATWAVDDDGAELVVRKPIEVTFSATIPADLTVELADVKALVGTAISFLYASVTAGTFSSTYLQKLLYGLPQVA